MVGKLALAVMCTFAPKCHCKHYKGKALYVDASGLSCSGIPMASFKRLAVLVVTIVILSTISFLPINNTAHAQGTTTIVATSESLQGGVYLCDLSTGSNTSKVALVDADFFVMLSPTTCLVSSDRDAASGGGLYLCDLNAGTATMKVPLIYASGLALESPVVGGVLVPVNELELLGPYLGLAGLAMAASAVVVVKRRSRR